MLANLFVIKHYNTIGLLMRYKTIINTFGPLARHLRQGHEMSLIRLADITGLHHMTLRNIEHKVAMFNRSTIRLLGSFYGYDTVEEFQRAASCFRMEGRVIKGTGEFKCRNTVSVIESKKHSDIIANIMQQVNYYNVRKYVSKP